MIIIVLLSVFITGNTAKSTKNVAIENMQTITLERAQIIRNYMNKTEDILTAYSKAGEVRTLLENPSDKNAVDAVQKYTERFAKDVANLEGIYIG